MVQPAFQKMPLCISLYRPCANWNWVMLSTCRSFWLPSIRLTQRLVMTCQVVLERNAIGGVNVLRCTSMPEIYLMTLWNVPFYFNHWVVIHLKSTKPYPRLAQRTRNQKGNWLIFFSAQRLIEYEKVDYDDLRVKQFICTLHTSGGTPSHVVLLNQIVRSSHIWHRLLQTLKLWKRVWWAR